jgi:hypothetical protein
LVSDIPAGNGKMAKLFLQCSHDEVDMEILLNSNEIQLKIKCLIQMGRGSFFMSEWHGLGKVIPTHPAVGDGKREFLYV